MNDIDEHRYWRQNFDNRLEALEFRLDASFRDIKESIDELRDAAVKGFPDDDPLGHRKVHENYIKKAEARNKLKSEVIAHIIKGISLAAIAFIATAVWAYIKGGQ